QAISARSVRSVTLTLGWVSISYSKEMVEIEPEEYLGVDCNLVNVTTASVNETARGFDLSKATRIKADYRYFKSRFKRNDPRRRTRVFSKYGEKQRNRIKPLLHSVSNSIVDEAKS